jgi:CubicO group peptidase (beta-lactamase class C family)
MEANHVLNSWPAEAAFSLFRVEMGLPTVLATSGDRTTVRPWASVSKMVLALAMGVEVDWGQHRWSEPMGPNGADLAMLLSHAAGLGLHEGDPRTSPGVKRVYSSYAYDHIAVRVVGDRSPEDWLSDRVLTPLGMRSVTLEGPVSSGFVGHLDDLQTLAVAYLASDLLVPTTRDFITSPYLPDLAGVVPGFGHFAPCPWGLGPEIRGVKQHWMGSTWSPRSYGHFGQSGALLLVDPTVNLGLVALSDAPFGPWATSLWPQWVDDVRALAGDL